MIGSTVTITIDDTVKKRFSLLAIVSLVLGVMTAIGIAVAVVMHFEGLFVQVLVTTCFSGLVLGILSTFWTDREGESLRGSRLGGAGIMLGIFNILLGIVIPSILRARCAADETHPGAAMLGFYAHQEVFRRTDADGNGAQDYWTADVAGLYALEDANGQMLKFLDFSMAKADVKPLREAYSWQPPEKAQPKAGYFWRVIERDAEGKPYRQDNDGDGKSCTNPSKYAVCAFPAEYNKDGIRTFITNESKLVYYKDTGGKPVVQWPGDDPLKQGWVVFE
jgi:hypothetical protein